MASNYIDAALEILETVGKTNVISSPRITVLNNEEAKVMVGTEQPYVESTTTVTDSGTPVTSQTVKTVDVGVELTVTPTINRDGYVTMKIKPEVSSLGEAIAAMSPCPCSYLELAERLISSEGMEKHSIFKEWCSFYASEESKKTVNYLIAILNKAAKKASTGQKKLMREHFIVSSKYEYLFWDMAYKMESWLI